jgi:hypothetical protein
LYNVTSLKIVSLSKGIFSKVKIALAIETKTAPEEPKPYFLLLLCNSLYIFIE